MGLKEKLIKSAEAIERKIGREEAYSETDLRFMSSLKAAVMQKSTTSSRIIVWTLLLFVLVFLVWAHFTQLDEVTRGSGKIIPSHQIQKIQYLEGGIISDILIHEGDIVEKGEALVKIEDIGFTTKFMENKMRLGELKAKAARLKAEYSGKDVVFDPLLEKEFPQIVRDETTLFRSRIDQLRQQIDVLKEQLKQRKNELEEAKSKRGDLIERNKLIKKEVALAEPLVKKNLVSEVELLKLKRQASEIKGSLDAVRYAIPRLESKITETEKNIKETRLGFQNKAQQEYNEYTGEIGRIEQVQQFLKDKVQRTMLRSPVAGTVKQLFINTIGGVIPPGKDIIEIVPMEDTLLAEVKIQPSDIAYLHPGQEAMVKFSAYDFSIYGGLKGKVVHISADTITNERGESYYLVRIETEKGNLSTAGKSLNIKAGMTVSVDILTGKKSVLDYILKPIFKARNNALKER